MWPTLNKHAHMMTSVHMRDLFTQNKNRYNQFSLDAAGLFLDYSKNRITSETVDLLIDLAKQCQLNAAIEQQFTGAMMNHTEQRAVLHTALRDSSSRPIYVNNENIKPLVHQTLQRMEMFAERIRMSNITDVIHLGIGGSDVGPAMIYKALHNDHHSGPLCHFISYLDSEHIAQKLKTLNPATTMVLVVSKSFTTTETLTNAELLSAWLGPTKIATQFMAVTMRVDRAKNFGIQEGNIFPMWDWVGGRYSLWSAVGLSLAIALGMETFRELLAGAELMDQHFRHTEFHNNMPVILGMLGIWYNNFFDAKTSAVIPYSHRLSLLPNYLQQSHMESQGKRVNTKGESITHNTGAILWGGVGTDSQHSFHQLLMQGQHLVPVDFILPQRHTVNGALNKQLIANCLAQSQALMCGYIPEKKDSLEPHKIILGNNPSNTIMFVALTPKTLGALVALYEHKIFVQSVIWGINAYDQWGVERGKVLAQSILDEIETGNVSENHDASTIGLLQKII